MKEFKQTVRRTAKIVKTVHDELLKKILKIS